LQYATDDFRPFDDRSQVQRLWLGALQARYVKSMNNDDCHLEHPKNLQASLQDGVDYCLHLDPGQEHRQLYCLNTSNFT
jgi:hypothetical protein